LKKRITIIFLSFSVLLSCGDNFHNSSDIFLAEEQDKPVIGKRIILPAMEAYYNGAIKNIDFKAYKNKWIILFFYPGDFTFVCPTELKELADYYDDFKAGGAEVFSISTDSAHVHKAWKKDSIYLKDVKFPMLSDRSGLLSRIMGVYEPQKGSAIRASFILNPERIVVSAEYSDDSVGRNVGELLRKFDAALAVRKGGGGMCPAGWTQGDTLITEE
jgi:peroxiredoxin (alkyl hydroperoxide reductase subunit C)